MCLRITPLPPTSSSGTCGAISASSTSACRTPGLSARQVLLVASVGLSLCPAMEEVVLRQSLSCSVNSAYLRVAARNFRINFAGSTTGDGFYIWNRADTLEGSAPFYPLMLLVLADNAI